MSSSRAATSQLTSGRIGGSASVRPGGNALRPPSMPERCVSPNVSRTPSGRPASTGSMIDVRLPNSEYAPPPCVCRATASHRRW
jgi:hypothetical protein